MCFFRIYATKFLGVLLRAKAHNVAHWGLDLITAQLFDQESRIVPIVALGILDEASDDKLNLEGKQKKSVKMQKENVHNIIIFF